MYLLLQCLKCYTSRIYQLCITHFKAFHLAKSLNKQMLKFLVLKNVYLPAYLPKYFITFFQNISMVIHVLHYTFMSCTYKTIAGYAARTVKQLWSVCSITFLLQENLLPFKLFRFGKQIVIRWSQVRCIWRMVYQFESPVANFLYCNVCLGCSRIILQERDAFGDHSAFSINIFPYLFYPST